MVYRRKTIPIHPETVCEEGEGEVPAHKALQQLEALEHLCQKNISFDIFERHMSSQVYEKVKNLWKTRVAFQPSEGFLSHLLLLPRPKIRSSSNVKGGHGLGHGGGSSSHRQWQAKPCPTGQEEEEGGQEQEAA